jgi:hypothetical protein
MPFRRMVIPRSWVAIPKDIYSQSMRATIEKLTPLGTSHSLTAPFAVSELRTAGYVRRRRMHRHERNGAGLQEYQ